MPELKDNNLLAEEFIRRVSPYEPKPSIDFDLRAYADYVTEHGLTAKDITPEILHMFSTAKS